MDIEISSENACKAGKCTKDKRCLNGNQDALCRVVWHMGDDMCFVRCLEDKDCPYLETYRITQLCNCPVRIEIYHRYKM